MELCSLTGSPGVPVGDARCDPMPRNVQVLSFAERSLSCTPDSMTECTRTDATTSPTIVMVDDDPEVRIVVAEFLEDFGYHVLQADGGAAALRLLAATPDVRLLISDIRMPDMSGLELADIATQRHQDLKVILISGYFVAKQVNRRFLRKPFRMNELRAAVRAELEEAS